MTNMMLKKNVVQATVFSAVLLVVSPAFAGFEWKSPGSPVTESKTAPEMQAQKVPGVEAVSVLTESEKKKMPAVASETVSGFGNDLPLTVALQQVIPEGYGFSLTPGVNADTAVSWQGEKPWREVLDNMLSPQGLDFSVQGTTVLVKQMTAGTPQAPVAVAAHKKADMIPDDILSDSGTNYSVAEPMTIRREKPEMLVQDVAALPEPTLSAESMPESLSTASAPSLPVTESSWRAAKGQTLKNTLDSWSKAAQVTLYWSIDYDYKMNEDLSYGGTFDQAVEKLFGQFTLVRPQPYGRLYREANGTRVLVVNSYDLTN